ncbi:winged helix-turn-helix transcriptional regulator [Microbispora sp. RL4-1S]|uniref:Winged helix-turn-helix transcriptional regulator n=1 Tax=Microbispora oryzae TaxID=2806554 RepID=A0A941AG50_9ACTN|nr:MarR family winged helix-turn-helix transcriptional regulator [Microbispora oryzae]MBP2702535.1 winged helix-turn-helix transcriptional regulator [Microbispora oryzae]
MGPTSPNPAPPTLLGLHTYLLSLTGKAARGRLSDRLASRGLRLWHMAVLAALADFGPHTQRDLCARLSVDPSDMAKIVEQLAGFGQIERTRDPADRRRVSVGLTDTGRRALTELVGEARAVQDEMLAPLTGDERAQLHSFLLKVFTAGPGAGTGARADQGRA